MKTCPRCGREKKSDKGSLCQPCAVHFSATKLKPDWKENSKRKYKLCSWSRNRKVTVSTIKGW